MKYLFTILFYLLLLPALAQEPEQGNWLSVQMNMQLSNKWEWHNDGGFRTIGPRFLSQQYLYRTGIRRLFNSKFSAAAGLAYFSTRTGFQKSDTEFGAENRIWQEGQHNWAMGEKVNIQNRIRTEERWFRTTGTTPAYFAFRFRHKVTAEWAFSPKWTLQVAEEYFRQWKAGNSTFNQFRLITQIRYRLEAVAQLQAGYMWLKWPDYVQHTLLIGFQKTISTNAKSRTRSSQ